MSDSAQGDSRFKRIIDKLDEQEGSPPPRFAQTDDNGSAVSAFQPISAPMPVSVSQATVAPRQNSAWESFKNFAILFSFVTNLILVVALIVLVVFIFDIKSSIAQPLVGGLYNGFVKMDQAHIETTIPVNDVIFVDDTIPVVFDLPLQQNTNVVLSQDTFIRGASVTIDGGILQLNNAPTTILLPRGTVLPVTLNITVPVSQTVPVQLTVPINLPVPVDIALSQTDLHVPFVEMRDLFEPYYQWMIILPDSWTQLFQRNP